MKTNGRGYGIALLLIATMAWGALFPIAKNALAIMDGFYLTAFRYGLASVIFAAILWLTEGRKAFRLEGRALSLFIFGSLGFAGFSILVFVGLSRSTSEHGAIIVALMPLITAVLSWVTKGIKLKRATLVCIAGALTGVLLVVTKGNWAALQGGALLPDLMIFLGAVCWLFYTMGAGQFSGWSPLRYTTISCLLGAVTILLVTAVATTSNVIHAPTVSEVLSVKWQIAYLVLIGGVMAVLSWNTAIKLVGAVNGVLFINMVPVTAFAIGIFQGRSFSTIELDGAAITILALIANNLSHREFFRRRADMSGPNMQVIFAALQISLRARNELTAMLQRAQMEKRDITDQEVEDLRIGNDILSEDLISRLRSTPPAG
ncbi:MAG: DMT family transporter [Gammaproteobacteria bacterium]|nr:DMT family transporter [Gammaproteobacteria bacterium]